MPFRNDYIMRIIQQLGVALAQIIYRKGREEYDEAEAIISRSAQSLLGFDITLLRRLSDEGIAGLLRRPDPSDVGAFLVAAELLLQQGDVDAARGREDDGFDCYHKALSLFLEACLGNPDVCDDEYAAKIDLLTERVAAYPLPPTIRRKLFAYYEQSGDYAEAENVIHHMLEDGDPVAWERGVAFYERLRGKSDAELARGGLPRDEMEEGLDAFGELPAP
jgi:tetratricopeptide (TPR) repeat protein